MALRYMPRTSEGKSIVRELRVLESENLILHELRSLAKNESQTRLSEFGRALVTAANASGVKQAFIANLLDVTPGAVSRQINR